MAAEQPRQEEQQQTSWGRTILNVVTIYFAVNAVTSFLGSRLGGQKDVVSTDGTTKPAAAVKGVEQFPALWPLGTHMVSTQRDRGLMSRTCGFILGRSCFRRLRTISWFLRRRGLSLETGRSIARLVSMFLFPRYALHLNIGFICRLFRITDLCSLILLFLRTELRITPRTRISTQSVPSTQVNVYSTGITNLIVVLTRYMPKKKEVHLKKLIKSSDELEKEAEAEVIPQLSKSNRRHQKSSP